MTYRRVFLSLIGALLVLATTAVAAAQETSDWDVPPATTELAPAAAPTDPAAPQTADPQVLDASKPDRGLKELPGSKLFQLGARFRWVFMPVHSFFGQVDVQAYDMTQPKISNIGIGAEFIYRRKQSEKIGLDITPAIWWVGLSWDGNIAFKETGESGNSWEVVTNSLSSLLFSVDFIWSADIQDWVAFTWGLGVGLGIPFGEITQTEASAASGGYEPCPVDAYGQPIPGDAWCNPGEEYNEVYQKFPIPWLNFLIGFRFKPHKNWAIYVDGGGGLGWQMGIRTGYIF